MPGGQRIHSIVVKPFNSKTTPVDRCRLEHGPCKRAGVDREFGSNEFYLEHWDFDGTLTIYVLPENIQHIISYARQFGENTARNAIRDSVVSALGLH